MLTPRLLDGSTIRRHVSLNNRRLAGAMMRFVATPILWPFGH